MRIRAALAADVPQLAALAARTWTQAFGAPLSAADVAAERARHRSSAYFVEALGRDRVLVAEPDRGGPGPLLGYAQTGAVDIPEAQARPRDRCLRRLYVDAPAQGRGIGRALLDAALARVADAPAIYLQVWEENRRAVALYERSGFRRVAVARFCVGEEEMEDLVMVRRRP